MSQLMGQERSALLDAWIILACSKHNIVAHGVRSGTYRARRLRRFSIRVHPHSAEVVAKALPHVLP